ncbi:MAG: hypothetical protein R3B95_20320 [Nitrospirales bacterium]|nr:hypothetical protein [Nitrospirales bacterium]
MKRLTPKARQRQIRLFRKKIRRAKKKRRRFRKAAEAWRRYIQIKAPDVFTVGREDARRKLLRFITRLRTVSAIDKKWVCIDFSGTQKMIADGTLIFFAELSRLRRLMAGHRVRFRCIAPRNAKVAQVLMQVGIFKLLGFRKKIEATFPDVIHWRSASGREVNGEKYDSVLGNYEGRIADVLGKKFFRGVTEAMTNCHHHAYISIRPDHLNAMDEPSEWWMFSQEKDGCLTVVFCDLGIGIPGSLPVKKPSLWQRVQTTFGSNLDAHAIQEAIADSRTRTGKHHRGKGLKQLIDVVSSASDGRVHIFSNKGCFTLKSGKEDISQFKDSILGTLIHWSVPIGDLTDDTV